MHILQLMHQNELGLKMDTKTLQLLSEKVGVELKIIDPQERMDKTLAKLKVKKGQPIKQDIRMMSEHEVIAKFYSRGRKD